MIRRGGLYLLLFLLALQGVFAQDYILSNSQDWRDVYSSMLYANLQSKNSGFLVSEKHSLIMISNIPSTQRVQIISSDSKPYAINYKAIFQSRGYPNPEEIITDSSNIDLARRLTGVTNFILVDDSVGYNAVAIASYAVVKKAYVFLVNSRNYDEVESLLADRKVDSLMIYGHVDRQVTDAFQNYNPEIINTGSRFTDNIEVVKRYRQIKPMKQIVISNGEFIEKEIMSGVEPVLFIGKESVPEVIKNFLRESDIEVAVLIGNELVGTATEIRRDTGVSTFVKFAQGARNPTSAISQVEGLDLFYLPTYTLDIDIVSIKYNKATDQLEVTYQNKAQVTTFLKGTITLTTNLDEQKRVGDLDAVYIGPNEFKTIVYDGIDLNGDSITAAVFTLFGETPASLEKILQRTMIVEIINVADNCNIEINGLSYSKSKKSFFVDISNIGDVDCYVDVELFDVLIANEKVTVNLPDVVKIESGSSMEIRIRQDMEDIDLEDNPEINLRAYYGERENSLVKVIQGKFTLTIKTGDVLFYVAIVAVVILIILFFLLAKRKKKKKKSK